MLPKSSTPARSAQMDSRRFRRLTGRKFGRPLAGFGERVWLSEPAKERVNKFNPRCVEARLLGFCLRSSRYIVVDFSGKFRFVPTVKRTGTEDRWRAVSPSDPFSADDLEATPAEFTCSRGVRGEVNPAAQRLERTLTDAPALDLPRRLYLRQEDFLVHGTSDHCPGCRALISGGRPQGHTEECRIRVEAELEKTEVGNARLQAAAIRTSDVTVERAVGSAKIQTTQATETQTESTPPRFFAEPALPSSAATAPEQMASRSAYNFSSSSTAAASDQVLSGGTSCSSDTGVKRPSDACSHSESEGKRFHVDHSTSDVVMLMSDSDVGQSVRQWGCRSAEGSVSRGRQRLGICIA